MTAALTQHFMLQIADLDFDVEAAELVKTLPPDWDLIIWAYNFDAFLAFDLLPGVSVCSPLQSGQDEIEYPNLSTDIYISACVQTAMGVW